MYSLVFLCHKDDLLYWQYYLLGSTGKQFGNTASAIKGPVPDSKDWLLLALHSTAWHRLNVLHANSKSSVLCQILPFQGIFKHSTLNVTIQTVSEQANYSSYLAPFQKEDFARSEQAHMDTHTCRGANIQRHTYTCRGAHTHIKRHVHVQTQTHTHTQHPTKSPFTNLTFQGHTWDDARFSLPLFLFFSRVHHMTSVISRDTKSSDSLSPLPPATTKPKHTVPHWDSDKAEGHFLRAIWYPALHISWAKLPCLTGAVFFLFLSVDTAQLFGYRILLVNYFPLLPCYQDYVYIFFTWMKLFRTLFLKTLISNSKLCWDYHEHFWA